MRKRKNKMKRNNLAWKIQQNTRDDAMAQGENIIEVTGISTLPINVFNIIKEEKPIHTEGDDFGDDFDGRLEYSGHRYLLVYNTKYNKEQYNKSQFHPRIRFTIAHELGHYFLETHRNMLRSGKMKYSCTTERFQAKKELELQADYFATGLLMPSKILSPLVNQASEPSLTTIKRTASQFQVSMTSMMLRWVKLSHFPCGVFSVNPKGLIEWGWVSEPLAETKAYRKNSKLISKDAQKFLSSAHFDQYSEEVGKGFLGDWVNTIHGNLSVEEFYAIMPFSKSLLVFIYAYEDEIMNADIGHSYH